MTALPEKLRLCLWTLQLAAWATVIRSVVLERWITVLGAAMLLKGASAALRQRTWGLGLSLAGGAGFGAAALLGMAPDWFWCIAVLGAAPFVIVLRPLVRFGGLATAVLALGAIAAGGAAAALWHEACRPRFVSCVSCLFSPGTRDPRPGARALEFRSSTR